MIDLCQKKMWEKQTAYTLGKKSFSIGEKELWKKNLALSLLNEMLQEIFQMLCYLLASVISFSEKDRFWLLKR